MTRPHFSGVQPLSLFQVIKVPVARHQHDGPNKPPRTIVKKIGGYHRRPLSKPDRKQKTFINFFKSTIQKIRDVFRQPASPLVRRIQELEDDIKMLRQKNDILEKGYTFGSDFDVGLVDAGDERSSTNTATNEYIILSENNAKRSAKERSEGQQLSDPLPGMRCDSVSVVGDGGEASKTALPPVCLQSTPAIPSSQQQYPAAGSSVFAAPASSAQTSIGWVPVAPPPPPIGMTLTSTTRKFKQQAAAQPVAASCPNTAAAKATSKSISLEDIQRVQLRSVQQRVSTNVMPRSSFQITSQELFSVPLRPVGLRSRPVRKNSESDNEEFKILRAAIRQRTEALYSPSVSTAASDNEWSASPNVQRSAARPHA